MRSRRWRFESAFVDSQVGGARQKLSKLQEAKVSFDDLLCCDGDTPLVTPCFLLDGRSAGCCCLQRRAQFRIEFGDGGFKLGDAGTKASNLRPPVGDGRDGSRKLLLFVLREFGAVDDDVPIGVANNMVLPSIIGIGVVLFPVMPRHWMAVHFFLVIPGHRMLFW
jgi:hypothetical protein